MSRPFVGQCFWRVGAKTHEVVHLVPCRVASTLETHVEWVGCRSADFEVQMTFVERSQVFTLSVRLQFNTTSPPSISNDPGRNLNRVVRKFQAARAFPWIQFEPRARVGCIVVRIGNQPVVQYDVPLFADGLAGMAVGIHRRDCE